MTSVIRFSLEDFNKFKTNDLLEINLVKKMNPPKKVFFGNQKSNTVSDFFCRIPEYMDISIIKKKLFKYLNLINESNFEKIKNNILGMLIKDDIKYFLLTEIFNKAINQEIYMDVYLKIFKELITDKEYGEELKKCYQEILKENIKKLSTKIESINPDKDYDGFCKSLKNRKIYNNIYIFIAKTYLLKLYLINNKQLYSLINNLFEQINISTKEENEMNLIVLKNILNSINNKKIFYKFQKQIDDIKNNKELINNRGKFVIYDILDNFK